MRRGTTAPEGPAPSGRRPTAPDGSAPPSGRRPIVSDGSVPSGRRPIVAAAAAALAVAGGLLTGCAAGPSQVSAAAIVGDTVIPIASVQGWFDRVVADRERKERARAGGQLDDIGRRVVTEAVRHELLTQAAEREHLRIDEERVTELLDELGGPPQARD